MRSRSPRAMSGNTASPTASRCTAAICSAPLGGKRYDLIISNPPYVDAEGIAALPRECRAEPKLAFDGGVDGIDIVQRILGEAKAHLNPQGGLFCEVGRCQPALVAAYPQLPLLWLDTEDSEGEVFWIAASDL